MPRRIALIIGVSQYDKRLTQLNNLAAPVNDAQAIYKVLHQYGDFDSLQTLPLGTQGVDSSGFVYATELLERIKEIFNPSTTDEVELAVIYFSGHGVSDRGQVVYLSASDERLAVALPWLANLAKKSSIQNICIWLDCCHSGEVLEFADLGDKGFCVVAASHAQGEALAKEGHSLLTDLLCKALTPTPEARQEVRVLDLVQTIEAERKNLPQQVLCRWGDQPFTLTQWQGEVAIRSPYPPDYPPYKGLLTFQATDQAFFFGRDAMVQQLLDRLSSSRFVPLLGASGSGKSSLVLAGLLPQLVKDDWQIVVMRPTTQPLQSLRDVLVRSFPDKTMGSIANSVDLERELGQVVGKGKQLLLVIDQFEEVFTECRSDGERTAFFACLLESLKDDNALHIVLTLRSDFLGHCTEQVYSGLGQRLQQDALLLIAPSTSELREMIKRPLVLVGMRCEQALEDELVDQTLHGKGSLPLLQYVLEKLWQTARQQGSRELTLSMYQSLGGQQGGGLRGVLNEKADRFYQQLEPQQQRLMEWLMVELVQVGDGQEDTRRTVTLQELHQRQPDYVEALDQLLGQLVTQERLLTQDQDDQRLATVTVAHEALIRDWQRLRGWLDSNREIKDWRLRLEDSIAAWKNKVSGSLLRERRLAEAQRVLELYPDSLLIGLDEKAFIEASAKQALWRKQAGILFVIALIVVIVAMTWQWQKAERQTVLTLINKWSLQASNIIESPSLANGDIDQGLLLAVMAWGLDNDSMVAQAILHDTLQAASSLDKVLRGEGYIDTIAFSPDGKKLISNSGDDLRLWDVQLGKSIGEVWKGHESNINAVAFSPDGTKVVSGSWDKTIRLWDIESGKQIGEAWRGHTEQITSIAFSPDGAKVISGGSDKTIRLWDVASGKQIGEAWRGHTEQITSIAFSPDGAKVVSSSWDKTLRLWNASTGVLIKEPFQGHNGFVTTVAFSPDGKKIISGSTDATLLLWDVDKGSLVGEPWRGHTDSILIATFTTDGKYVISGSEDKVFRLWEVSTGSPVRWNTRTYTGTQSLYSQSKLEKIIIDISNKKVAVLNAKNVIRVQRLDTESPGFSQVLYGHQAAVISTAFSPDGEYILSASADKTIRLWSTITKQQLGKPWIGHIAEVMSVAFSPNGNQVVSGSLDGTLRLWDVKTGQQIGEPWSGHTNGVVSVAFSPDGKYVISGSQDETLRLWDVTTGKTIGDAWEGHIVCKKMKVCPFQDSRKIFSVAFSPNGQLIASNSLDIAANGFVLFRKTQNREVVYDSEFNFGHSDGIVSLRFSPDGKYVISTGWDSNLRLWDTTTGQPIGEPWHGHESTINSAVFSPDGKYVISGSHDQTLRLWDANTGNPIGRAWYGHKSMINSVVFSPDGKFIVSGSSDKTIRLWDADPESWAKKACSIVNRNFSLVEWQRFIGDALPYQKTCPDLPAPGEEGWVEPYNGE